MLFFCCHLSTGGSNTMIGLYWCHLRRGDSGFESFSDKLRSLMPNSIIRWGMIIVILCLLILFCSAGVPAGEARDLPSPVPTGRYWVFLERERMSPVELDRVLDEAARGLTARSLERRRKVIDREPPVRVRDLPVSHAQIEAVEAVGCRVVRQFRYLNAVTVTGSAAALSAVERLHSVKEVRPVMAYARSNDPDYDSDICRSTKSGTGGYFTSDQEELYGRSWAQLLMVNLPAVHERGYRGRGVLIGVQDTGFDNLDHVCFDGLEVMAAYDFLNDDDDVSDHGDIGSGAHGTRTLSVIAGLDSGWYIGAAPEARFVLTKTENSESETPVEEDYWVAGLWFHDSLGVDVLSSSVSYCLWYDWEEMDGRTAVTSQAADIAVEAGMVIVNSTGNHGRLEYPDSKISAPADARGVISVGGVDRGGDYWRVASQGPTYDGRIKPDVAAQAQGVYGAFNLSDTDYLPYNGTSFSCPIVAGIAALMLQAHRWLTPADVMEILHESSSRGDNPDTLIGWGIPDALAAVEEAESRGVAAETPLPVDFTFNAYPNPFNGRLNLEIGNGLKHRSVQIYDITGRRLNLQSVPVKSDVMTVDFSGYAVGVYVIKIGSNAGEKVGMVVFEK